MSCANQNSYDLGDAVKLYGDFKSPDTGLYLDPAGAISVVVRDPAGVETTYSYPADIVKVETGRYTYAVSVDQAGTWFYRWIAEGQAQEEQRFYVKAGVVTSS